jgi:hypothetical protein
MFGGIIELRVNSRLCGGLKGFRTLAHIPELFLVLSTASKVGHDLDQDFVRKIIERSH